MWVFYFLFFGFLELRQEKGLIYYIKLLGLEEFPEWNGGEIRGFYRWRRRGLIVFEANFSCILEAKNVGSISKLVILQQQIRYT